MVRLNARKLGNVSGLLFRWCWLLLLLGGASLLALAQDTASFTFNPPDGLTYVTTQRSIMTTGLSINGEEGVKLAMDQVVKTKTVIHKTATGYAITQTVFSIEKSLNGTPVPAESMLRMTLNKPVTYNVTAEGKLLSVSGTDKIAQNCVKIMAPMEREMYGPTVTAKGLIDAYTSDWIANTQSLIGRTMKADESWKINVAQPVPGGKRVAFSIETKFLGNEQYMGRDGIRLQYTKQCDLQGFSAARAYMFRKLIHSLATAADVNLDEVHLKVSVKEVSETGENVLDTITMQPLTGFVTRTIVTQLGGPNDMTLSISEHTQEDIKVKYDPLTLEGVE